MYTRKEVKKLLHAQVIACAHTYAKQPQSASAITIFEAIKKTSLVDIPEKEIQVKFKSNLSDPEIFRNKEKTSDFYLDGIKVTKEDFLKHEKQTS